MNDYLAALIRKYLNNQCSEEEASMVLQYFDTAEGQAYLSHLIDADIEKMDGLTKNKENYSASDPLPSIYSTLQAEEVKKRTNEKKHTWYWIAAVFVGFLVSGTFYQLFFADNLIIQHTAYGETRKVTLSDGTVITLNANSTLKYLPDFEQNRDVWLEGEAFFEVEQMIKPNTSGNSIGEKALTKFTVHTGRLLVEVTGTSFNINDREDKTQVVLNTGKIRLKAQTPERAKLDVISMNPGDMIEVLAHDGKMVKKVVDPEIYSSWRDNKLVCYDTPLQVIAQVIQHNYGLQVVFKEAALSQMVVTGTLPTDHLDLLLEVLSESMNLSVKKEHNTIFIEKR